MPGVAGPIKAVPAPGLIVAVATKEILKVTRRPTVRARLAAAAVFYTWLMADAAFVVALTAVGVALKAGR